MLGGGGGGDLALLSVPVVSVPCQLPGPAAARKPYQIRSSVSSHHPTPATTSQHQPTTVTTKYFLLGPEMRLQQGSRAVAGSRRNVRQRQCYTDAQILDT